MSLAGGLRWRGCSNAGFWLQEENPRRENVNALKESHDNVWQDWPYTVGFQTHD
jgi:hypothetical protein